MKAGRICKDLSFWLVINQMGFGSHVKSLSSMCMNNPVVRGGEERGGRGREGKNFCY